ncbi:hypothetical protein ACS0PU_012360 [Formica fusca]
MRFIFRAYRDIEFHHEVPSMNQAIVVGCGKAGWITSADRLLLTGNRKAAERGRSFSFLRDGGKGEGGRGRFTKIAGDTCARKTAEDRGQRASEGVSIFRNSRRSRVRARVGSRDALHRQ